MVYIYICGSFTLKFNIGCIREFLFMEDFKAAEITRLNNLDFRQKILTVIASV